jgi:hypothetical protein
MRSARPHPEPDRMVRVQGAKLPGGFRAEP